jgi:type IV secretion system protein VirD4
MDESGKIDFNLVSQQLESTLADYKTVFNLLKTNGSTTQKITVLGIFGIAIYILMKVTDKKKLHRRGEEHGSARWANENERKSLLDKPDKKKKKADKKNKQRKRSKSKIGYVPDNNIILTNDVKMSLNTRQTRKNLNVMVIGGSGSGKSRFYVKPNIMQANTSYVCTDPKGELLRSCGKFLENQGYEIKVFNLIDMGHSNNYNPFDYIYDTDGNYSETAVIKMINVLMKNTKEGDGGGGDQFWDDSTKALLSALCFYLIEVEDKEKCNFSEVMKLLKKAEVKEGNDEFQSDLDLIFDAVEHPEKYDEEKRKQEEFKNLPRVAESADKFMCLKYYKDFKKAAGDTAKSILISTAVRLQAFNLPKVMDLTCCDNLELNMIGDRKTALFIIIPSSDNTFNFLAAMMYTQLFDVLYDRANFVHHGRLPVHVRCLLDEFANIGQIPRFEELLATMRSMEISANVIIQNLSQLKKMYKDSWENVLGNCDSLLFLGGQEPTTLEHVSKMLGKETIDTVSRSRSKGKNSSSSTNDGILGRELMTVDELKVMKDEDCILFVRGLYPFFSKKFKIEKHNNYKYLEDSDRKNAYEISYLQTEQFKEPEYEDINREPEDENPELNAEIQAEIQKEFDDKKISEQDILETVDIEEHIPSEILSKNAVSLSNSGNLEIKNVELSENQVPYTNSSITDFNDTFEELLGNTSSENDDDKLDNAEEIDLF